ncbi:hypothetical protein [Pontixanthobacter sp. CEM42]|uniref:Kelch repeat-containing protein n=1 Tax=Pontixanthobacter sp. CEM42 TaxID=2792077 RepID=UPI001AE0812B|nr:hypothetical protein [Pontixanthobacter sp. CEM42]
MRFTRRSLGKALTATAVLAGSNSALAATGHTQGHLHIPRYGPAICSDGTQAILSGGAPVGAARTEDHFYSSLLGIIETIDPASLDQNFVANAIFVRANHASVWANGQIWLLGGRTRDGTDGRLVSETERIDPKTQAIWRGPDLPTPLIHLSAVTFGQSIFAFGGVFRDPETRRSIASSQIYECAPPYDRWISRTPMPLALGNAAAVTIGNRIFLIGGYDQEKAHAIVQIYDPVRDLWSLGNPPPMPLSAHAATGSGSRIFVFGDYANQSSVLGFDTLDKKWRTLDAPFTPRRHVRATTVSKRIVVAGGNQSSVAPATHAVESFSVDLLNTQFDQAQSR